MPRSTDPGILPAALVERAVVDPQQQAAVVRVPGQRGDAVREAVRVGPQRAVSAADRRRPTGVQVDVAVSGIAHARGDHRVDGLAHALLGQRDAGVPGVPAQRRRLRLRRQRPVHCTRPAHRRKPPADRVRACGHGDIVAWQLTLTLNLGARNPVRATHPVTWWRLPRAPFLDLSGRAHVDPGFQSTHPGPGIHGMLGPHPGSACAAPAPNPREPRPSAPAIIAVPAAFLKFIHASKPRQGADVRLTPRQ